MEKLTREPICIAFKNLNNYDDVKDLLDVVDFLNRFHDGYKIYKIEIDLNKEEFYGIGYSAKVYM